MGSDPWIVTGPSKTISDGDHQCLHCEPSDTRGPTILRATLTSQLPLAYNINSWNAPTNHPQGKQMTFTITIQQERCVAWQHTANSRTVAHMVPTNVLNIPENPVGLTGADIKWDAYPDAEVTHDYRQSAGGEK